MDRQKERWTLCDCVVAIAGVGQIIRIAVATDLHTVLYHTVAVGVGGVLLRPFVAARRADRKSASILRLNGHHTVGASAKEIIG